MSPGIVIVDYGMGNLRSVEKAFENAGAKVSVSSDGHKITQADKIVLPGVGAFSHAMRELRARKLVEPILEKINEGAPYLGLCLGLQLLFETSQEGSEKGLAVLPGNVVKFQGKMKIPHMGWNNLKLKQKDNPLFRGAATDDFYYFVHSFYALPKDKNVIASTTDYNVDFCSSVWKENIFATQFHPEKSQKAGQVLIRNFVRL